MPAVLRWFEDGIIQIVFSYTLSPTFIFEIKMGSIVEDFVIKPMKEEFGVCTTHALPSVFVKR
jgi:hypothetical protein